MNSTKTCRRLNCFLNVAFSFSLIMLYVHPAIGQTKTDTPPTGDRLTLKRNGKEYNLVGDIEIEAQDDSLYFIQDNGRIWFVQPDEIVERIDSDQDAPPATIEAMEKSLLEELPAGFKILKSDHYLIAYQTEKAYAKWVKQLYEGRLYKAFDGFWERKKKLPLQDPEFPLVVLIFKSKAEYQRYVDRDLGPGQDIVAYFHMQTNRVVMYDLTAGDRRLGENISSTRRIEEIFQNPAAVYMVATIIHEGTHQLMFNRGVQTRFADTPLWMNEGLAIFFEAPNLKNKRGWTKPGLVFGLRLYHFRNTLKTRPKDSIQRLLTDDARLTNPETAADGYAEAWAFNHFLLNKRSEEYIAYLKEHAEKPPLSELDAKQRLEEFKKHFGDDFEKLEKDFLKYVRRLQ